MNLNGAVAFITGASSGLGERTAELLADEGVNVAVGYKSGEDRARAVCGRLEGKGVRAIAVQLDHSQEEQVDAAIAMIVDRLGGLDILVNNAAMAMGGHDVPPGDLTAFTPAIWDEMMNVNLRGPFLVSRAAAPHLKASGWGRIVNIGSTIGHGEWYSDRAFFPSKAAMVPLTRFLAGSLAPDVTVNCISPGLMAETRLGSGGPEEFYDWWRNRARLGVTTSIDDVAAQVVCFCKATSVTGQSVIVDGGINFQ